MKSTVLKQNMDHCNDLWWLNCAELLLGLTKWLLTHVWAWVACFLQPTLSVAWHLVTIPSITVQKAEWSANYWTPLQISSSFDELGVYTAAWLPGRQKLLAQAFKWEVMEMHLRCLIIHWVLLYPEWDRLSSLSANYWIIGSRVLFHSLPD